MDNTPTNTTSNDNTSEIYCTDASYRHFTTINFSRGADNNAGAFHGIHNSKGDAYYMPLFWCKLQIPHYRVARLRRR